MPNILDYYGFKFEDDEPEVPSEPQAPAAQPSRNVLDYYGFQLDDPDFDPEGGDYDYKSANQYGITPDETGHYPSRNPVTGQILKGRAHPTWALTEQTELDSGYEIFQGEDGKYYSRKNVMAGPKFEPATVLDLYGFKFEDDPNRQMVRRNLPEKLLHMGKRINMALPQVVRGLAVYEQARAMQHRKLMLEEVLGPNATEEMRERVMRESQQDYERAKRVEATVPDIPEKAFEGGVMGVIEDALVGLAQFAPVMAVTPFSPGASYFITTAMIAGDKYRELKQEGKSDDVAWKASNMSGLLQAGAEVAGNAVQLSQLGKILNVTLKEPGKIVAKKMAVPLTRRVVDGIWKNAATEGIEEIQQKMLDVIPSVWANDPSVQDDVGRWADEVLTAWKDPKFIKEALYEGLVGAVGGAILPVGAGMVQLPFEKTRAKRGGDIAEAAFGKDVSGKLNDAAKVLVNEAAHGRIDRDGAERLANELQAAGAEQSPILQDLNRLLAGEPIENLPVRAEEIVGEEAAAAPAAIGEEAAISVEGQGGEIEGVSETFAGMLTPEDAGAIVEAESTPERQGIQRIAAALGLKVTFYKAPTQSTADNVNGFYHKERGRVYINETAVNPALVVLGHESFHRLEREDPELFKRVIDLTQQTAANFDQYVEGLNKDRRAAGLREFDITKEDDRRQLVAEFGADIVGQQFADPKFWRRLNKIDPTMAQRIAQVVSDIIEALKRVFRRQNLVAPAELERVQEEIAKVYGERVVRAERRRVERRKKKVPVAEERRKAERRMPETKQETETLLEMEAEELARRLGHARAEGAPTDAIYEDHIETQKQLIRGLAQAAFVDPQMGIKSKIPWLRLKALESEMPVEQRKWKVFFDLDNFSWYNDVLGHNIGDKIIEVVGKVFQMHAVDPYRIGGEELVDVLDTREQAERVAKKIRNIIENHLYLQANIHESVTTKDNVFYKGGDVYISHGIGVSYGIDQDIDNADKKLLAEKKRREKEGLRSPKGAIPVRVRKRPAPAEAGFRPEILPSNLGEIANLSVKNVKPWPEDFPLVQTLTSVAWMRAHPLYQDAKNGDVGAALEIGEEIIGRKPDLARQLAESYPEALLVPVVAEEAQGRNAIPLGMAFALEQATGLPIHEGIVQVNLTGHTGASAIHRFLSRAVFSGPVETGREYVLVDDAVTMGGTLSSLRHYIENEGGIVRAVVTAGAAKDSTQLAPRAATLQKLEEKHGIKTTEKILQQLGITGRAHALTEGEINWILSFANLDNLRSRLVEEIRERGAQADAELAEAERQRLKRKRKAVVPLPARPVPAPVKAPSLEAMVTDRIVSAYARNYADAPGFVRTLRRGIGQKAWESMSREEQIAEARQYVEADIEQAKREIGDRNPVDYLMDRALDPLDPANEFYAEILRRQGARVVAGEAVELSEGLRDMLALTAEPVELLDASTDERFKAWVAQQEKTRDPERHRRMVESFGPDILPIGQAGDPEVVASVKEREWTVDFNQTAFGIVNNRISRELDVFEQLFGPSKLVQEFPGKEVEGKRPLTRSITPYHLLQEIYRVIDEGQVREILNRSIDPMELAKSRGFKGEQAANFVKKVKMMRTGSLYMPSEEKGGELLSENAKAGASADFLLATCHPTEECVVCYAARTMIRQTPIEKAFRNTFHILVDPIGWAERVAAEVSRAGGVGVHSKVALPFIRLQGSGDLTTTEQLAAYNHLAKLTDRPIQIFSRHHDMLRQLKGTQNAPFLKMGSVDMMLFEHLGIDYLIANQHKHGIANAYLVFDPTTDNPIITELSKARALGLTLSVRPKYHDMIEDLAARQRGCPCDAQERAMYSSCRQCAGSNAGCFTAFAEMVTTKTGRLVYANDPKRPRGTKPVLRFLAGVPERAGFDADTQLWMETAVRVIRQGIKHAQLNIRNFTGPVIRDTQGPNIGKINPKKVKKWQAAYKAGELADHIIVKDVRWENSTEKIDPIEDLKDLDSYDKRINSSAVKMARAHIENLRLQEKVARMGKFILPGGRIQPGVAFKDGTRLADASLISDEDAKDAAFSVKPSDKYQVGKQAGPAVYVHRHYESLLPKVDEAKRYIGRWQYEVVKHNAETGNFSFIQSPDFDTADEPIVGDALLVRPDGSTKIIRQADDPWIYHHKWMMVDESYEGFSYHDSRLRSEAWDGLSGVDRTRIGKKSYWEKHIASRIPPVESIRLQKQLFANGEVAAANRTARSGGAVGENAIVIRTVLQMAKDDPSLLEEGVLDFGAGVPDSTGKLRHVEKLKAAGFTEVAAHEFGKNFDARVHDQTALQRQHRLVYASNVLNVQSSLDMFDATLKQLVDATADENGRLVVNAGVQQARRPLQHQVPGRPNRHGRPPIPAVV